MVKKNNSDMVDKNSVLDKDFTSFVKAYKFFKDNIETFAIPNIQDLKPRTVPSAITLSGSKSISVNRVSPKIIEQFLLKHPVVPRGIEIKANRMTGRGFSIDPANDSRIAMEMADKMRVLIRNSGGELLINRWIQDALAFGNGYLTLVSNKNNSRIVKLTQEHPIYFRIARHKVDNSKNKLSSIIGLRQNNSTDMAIGFDGPFKIDLKTRRPAAFVQVIDDEKRGGFVPFGEEIPADRVAHLTFDTWGDEVEGISIIQYTYMIINWLLNISEGAAEAMFRTGHTQKKVTTNIRTERELKKLAKNLEELNARDVVILPDGTDVTNLQPSPSDFPRFHEVFLTLLAIRLGIPKPILTLDGTSVNKATMDSLMRDMIADLHADELKLKNVIEDQIFIPVLKLEFESKFNTEEEFFSNIPSFNLKPVEETKEAITNRYDTLSQAVERLINSAISLIDIGKVDEANRLIKFATNLVPLEELPEIRNIPRNFSSKFEDSVNKKHLKVINNEFTGEDKGVSKGKRKNSSKTVEK